MSKKKEKFTARDILESSDPMSVKEQLELEREKRGLGNSNEVSDEADEIQGFEYLPEGPDEKDTVEEKVYTLEEMRQRENEDQERTRINKKLFLEFFERSRGVITFACQKINISRAIYYVWMKNDRQFRKAVRETARRKLEFLEDQMYLMAMNNNFKAVAYLMGYLDRREKKEPHRVTTVNINHHATPLSERKESNGINLSLGERLTLAEYESKETPRGIFQRRSGADKEIQAVPGIPVPLRRGLRTPE